jgi:hypothetical protein
MQDDEGTIGEPAATGWGGGFASVSGSLFRERDTSTREAGDFRHGQSSISRFNSFELATRSDAG